MIYSIHNRIVKNAFLHQTTNFNSAHFVMLKVTGDLQSLGLGKAKEGIHRWQRRLGCEISSAREPLSFCDIQCPHLKNGDDPAHIQDGRTD